MNKALLCAALAGIASATFITTVQAADETGKEKEKCYGIAKAGKNDCKSADGKNSCAGHGTRENDPNEWKYVEKGECVKAGGSINAPEAAKH